MTNKDKYLKDGVSEYDFVNFVFNQGNIGWNTEEDYCYIKKIDLLHLLQQPIKPSLTEDEKVILNRIDTKFIKIGKTNDGDIYFVFLWNKKPQQYYSDVYKKDLFQFIQPRRRI